MKIDPLCRYESADDFFDMNGSVVMKMSANSATAVCNLAGARGLVITRVEGGIWHDPGFEARIDCIWDGVDPPINFEIVIENNFAAAEFIKKETPEHDVFILTVAPLDGLTKI